MPVAADQFGPVAYLWILLVVVPLLFLEKRQNLPKAVAILVFGALLSLSTCLMFGFSDLARFALVIEFLSLAFLLERSA
jgi:hypothetical protein